MQCYVVNNFSCKQCNYIQWLLVVYFCIPLNKRCTKSLSYSLLYTTFLFSLYSWPTLDFQNKLTWKRLLQHIVAVLSMRPQKWSSANRTLGLSVTYGVWGSYSIHYSPQPCHLMIRTLQSLPPAWSMDSTQSLLEPQNVSCCSVTCMICVCMYVNTTA